MHVVLLDNPGLMQKSLRFFVKRLLSERAVNKRKRSALRGPP